MPALPETRVGDPIRHEALTVFPLFTQGEGLGRLPPLRRGDRRRGRHGRGGRRGRLRPRPPRREQGGLPRPLHRGRGTAGGQAEPGPEHLGPDRRPQQDHDPGQLRRAGPLAVSVPPLRPRRRPLVLEAAAHPEEVGHPLGDGGPGPPLRPGGGLEGGGPPDGLPGLLVRDDGHGGHLRLVPAPDGGVPGRLGTSRGRPGSPWRWASPWLRSTSSTSPRPAEGVGPAPDGLRDGRPGGQAGRRDGGSGRRRGPDRTPAPPPGSRRRRWAKARSSAPTPSRRPTPRPSCSAGPWSTAAPWWPGDREAIAPDEGREATEAMTPASAAPGVATISSRIASSTPGCSPSGRPASPPRARPGR